MPLWAVEQRSRPTVLDGIKDSKGGTADLYRFYNAVTQKTHTYQCNTASALSGLPPDPASPLRRTANRPSCAKWRSWRHGVGRLRRTVRRPSGALGGVIEHASNSPRRLRAIEHTSRYRLGAVTSDKAGAKTKKKYGPGSWRARQARSKFFLAGKPFVEGLRGLFSGGSCLMWGNKRRK